MTSSDSPHPGRSQSGPASCCAALGSFSIATPINPGRPVASDSCQSPGPAAARAGAAGHGRALPRRPAQGRWPAPARSGRARPDTLPQVRGPPALRRDGCLGERAGCFKAAHCGAVGPASDPPAASCVWPEGQRCGAGGAHGAAARSLTDSNRGRPPP